jgi:hypothetical protein
MLYFDLIPDDIIVILFKYHFKDIKELSRVSERLNYNYEKIISLIKNGHIKPELWAKMFKNTNMSCLIINLDREYISVNDIDIDNGAIFYKNISNILSMDENILQVYYNYDDSKSDYQEYLKIFYKIYKIKSSKELLGLLSNNNIDISLLKSDEVYVNINQYWNNIGRQTDIYINFNWNKFWNMKLGNQMREVMLTINNIL